MENSLKQRLVGAVVLIALAVIFLPAILKEKQQTRQFESKIPPKPVKLQTYQLNQQAQENTIETSQKLDQAQDRIRKTKQQQQQNALDKDKVDTIASDEKPKQADQNKPVNVANRLSSNKLPKQAKPIATSTNKKASFKDAAWIIQVASFANKTNADKLVAKLKKDGHKAYRRDAVDAKKKPLYRIFVGPFMQKDQASGKLNSISKISQSKAMLKAYKPTEH